MNARQPGAPAVTSNTLAKAIAAELTVIIPAYNEEGSIADTIRSIQAQTTPPKQIMVVDDGSTDQTGVIAAACGVQVLQPRVIRVPRPARKTLP